MIRGNYSLAQEVRRNELKQRQKIQQRQKQQHKLDKLSSCDPIKLYFHIRKLEALEERKELDPGQEKRLQTLRQDWTFIVKNKLFRDKVDKFLKSQEEAQLAKRKAEQKLLGKESVYFNAELNPLGKVPIVSNVTIENCTFFRNLKKSSRNKIFSEPDPIIAELGIRPPEGEPPRFYKSVQNTTVQALVLETETNVSTIPKKRKNYHDPILDSDSEEEIMSDD